MGTFGVVQSVRNARLASRQCNSAYTSQHCTNTSFQQLLRHSTKDIDGAAWQGARSRRRCDADDGTGFTLDKWRQQTAAARRGCTQRLAAQKLATQAAAAKRTANAMPAEEHKAKRAKHMREVRERQRAARVGATAAVEAEQLRQRLSQHPRQLLSQHRSQQLRHHPTSSSSTRG